MKRLLFIIVITSFCSSVYGQAVLTNHGKITVVQGTALSIHGDFHQASDDLNLIDSAAFINLHGNLANQGNGTFTDGATGALTIHGDSIHSPNSHLTLRNLTINQPIVGDTLLMSGVVEVKDHLTFTSGAMNIRNDSLLITDVDTLKNYTRGILNEESENNNVLASNPAGVLMAFDHYSLGYSSDELQQTINKGNLGFSCLFNDGGAGGTITVTRFPNPSTTLPNGSINRMYKFETTNNETGGTVTFNYFDSELGSFAGNEAILQLYHSTDNGTTWAIVPSTLDTAANTATSGIVADMTGLWTMSDCDAPAITLATNDVVCQDGTVTLSSTITPAGNYTFQWFADGVLLENETSASIVQEVGDQPVIMTLELTTDLGCTVHVNDTLKPIPSPVIALEESILKCAEESITVDAGAAFSSYEWANENGDVLGTDPTIDLLVEGVYMLTVADSTTCSNSDTISIINHELANLARFNSETRTCESSYNLGEFLALDNPGATFVWENESGETASGSNYPVTLDGNYTVEITSENGCITTATTAVTLNTTEFANLGQDISLACPTVTLDAGFSGASYLWSDGSTDQTLTVKNSGLYWVETQLSPTCIGRDSIEVELLPATDSAFFLSATEGYVNDTLFFIGLVDSPTTSILWDFDDGNTKNDVLFPYNLYAFTGEYDPTLTTVFENGCVSSYSKHIVIIEENGEAGGRIALEEAYFKDVTIFPNPNDGRFSVEVELNRPSPLEFRLIQISPTRLIDDIVVPNTDTYLLKEFNYSFLSVGAYQLIVKAGDEIKSYRIIVIR